MTTYNTESDVIESDVAFSLVDPTTVAGRAHRLHNNSASNLVVSSTGATPFTQGGINSATLTLLPGSAVNVYSNGTRWTVASGIGRQIAAGTGVTDGSGNLVIVFPTAFTVTPDLTVGIQVGGGNFYFHKITALNTTGATIHLDVAATVTVLTIVVLAGATNASGVTVHWIATTPGATP